MHLKERTKWIIEYVIKREKLSNYKLGKILGVKPDTVKSYRSKLANPKIDFIVTLCDRFGIDLFWFAKGEGEPFAGAMSRFPEVCTQSRYEIGNSADIAKFSPAGTLLPVSVVVDNENSATCLAMNSTEKSFLELCKIIGIPIVRGWKTKLARHLGITPAQLSSSISRDRLSKNLLRKIDEKGYDAKRWFRQPETTPIFSVKSEKIAAELSLQRLALLAGIKIDGNWISNLAGLLGVTPWAVGFSVLKDSIEEDLLRIIDSKGFKRETWVVDRSSKAEYPAGKSGVYSNEELVKIAWEILSSGSTHAVSLAMNILSLHKALLAEKDPTVDKEGP